MTGPLLDLRPRGRMVMAMALLLAIALQLLLDQQRLFDRWQPHGYDYSQDVMLDRYLMAGRSHLLIVLVCGRCCPISPVDPYRPPLL